MCSDLGAYVRYGVQDPVGLFLMRAGVRSRRLASAISGDLPEELDRTVENVRSWLGAQDVGDWRARYATTPSELLDLLEFTRVRRRSLLKTLLESGSVTVDLPEPVGAISAGLSLEPRRGDLEPAPLCVYSDDIAIATIAPRDHADVDAILSTGLELSLSIEASEGDVQLGLSTVGSS